MRVPIFGEGTPLRVSPPFFLNHLGFVILFIFSLELELVLKIYLIRGALVTVV